ncbi:MAG: DUF4242 domain-containing protein [Propionibacteriales bacterium]|nr:DUF4242 domain-containing protein [Propionibacteriales bacterium]
MPYFIDTHNQAHGTYPTGIDVPGLAAFLPGFLEACAAEGVAVQTGYVNFEAGKITCITSGPDAEAVRRAHLAVGYIPDPEITQVSTISPADLFFPAPGA